MEKLVDLFCIKPGDVVSVVGAGGKTTLVFELAAELKLRYPTAKILVTTTTKMFAPKEGQADFIWLNKTPVPRQSGVYFVGYTIEGEKVTAPKQLEGYLEKFDIAVIEADGASGKSLKAWAEHEPVVIEQTTKSIGVLNLKLMGMPAVKEDIHRLEIFLKLTGGAVGDDVTLDMFLALIQSPEGIFRNARGQRILYVITAGNTKAGYEIFDYSRKEAITCVLR